MTPADGTALRAGSGPEASRWDNLPACNTRCRAYRARVRTERIGYVNAVFESYEVIARVRTEDIQRGVLVITVPDDWDAAFRSVMAALKNEAGLELLDCWDVDDAGRCDRGESDWDAPKENESA